MDPNQHYQPAKGASRPMQAAHDRNQNQSNYMMAPPNPQMQVVVPSPYPNPREQQYTPYFMYPLQQSYLQQQLYNFWARKRQEAVETNANDFKTRNLPVTRIRRVMKAGEGVNMVAAEAPVLFAKACEMFIEELTMRAWANTDFDKRTIVRKSDIAHAISTTDEFDFLVDIVSRDDTVKQEESASMLQQNIADPSSTTPTMITEGAVLDQNLIGQQSHPFPTPMMPAPTQEDNRSSN